jgi:hypothetical protein
MRIDFRRLTFGAILAPCVIGAPRAHAQHEEHRGPEHRGYEYRGYDFHGRDYGRFSPAERGMWRTGHWEHGWHDGRNAWWWVAGGGWYFYPAPVYPFPTYVPPAIVVQQPPPVPAGQPPSQSWYYCDNPAGYYPYVAACEGPWREVPAAPTPPK